MGGEKSMMVNTAKFYKDWPKGVKAIGQSLKGDKVLRT